MRRYLLPLVVFVVAMTAAVLAGRADRAADPDDPAPDQQTAVLGTPLLSVRRVPEWLRQPTNDNLLDTAVRLPIDEVGEAGAVCLSVHRNGQSITEVASSLPFIPGEIQRLITVAALDTVGDRAFTTEVVRSASAGIVDGVLGGDLWLIGGADPVLSTSAFLNRFDDDRAFTSLEELALSVAVALGEDGITTIDGQLIGVDSKYDGSPQVFSPTTWSEADRRSGTVGLTAGLLVNNGIATFPAEVNPPADVRASDPVAHAAAQLEALLRVAGITVTGGATAGDAPNSADRESVGSIESPPLSEIAARAAIDGTTAEMLFREVTVRNGNSASSLLNASFDVLSALVQLGLVPEDEVGLVPVFDGSGLSLDNRARCDTVTGILDEAGLAAAALPDAADSPLAACSPADLPELRVLASARTEVTAMAGRAIASNGDVITFSVIANWAPGGTGASGPRTACNDLLPAVLEAIAQHPAGPPLDELTPLGPVSGS